MWVWLWYFIQCIHLCLCVLRWSWVIFLNFLKHINISVFIHLPVFHWFIIIWRCRLTHKPGLYTSYNIFSLANHRLLTWNLLWLIRYYRNPYSILISMTLNHKLRLRSILHLLIRMSSRLHLSSWRLSFKTVPSLKTPSPYVPPYHKKWSKRHVPHKPFFCSQNLSIQHWILIWGFCKPCILLSIFKIIFYLTFNNLLISLQVQLSL